MMEMVTIVPRGIRPIASLFALLIALAGSSPAWCAWWTTPGSGTHIIPDPRAPVPGPTPTPPPPTPIPPSPLPPPANFVEHLKAFIRYSNDVASMRAWYASLTDGDRMAIQQQYEKALGDHAELGQLLITKITAQLDRGLDSNLYVLTGVVKQFDTFRARGIFLEMVNTVSQRIYGDYVQEPHDRTRARRARDMQSLRAWIGFRDTLPDPPPTP